MELTADAATVELRAVIEAAPVAILMVGRDGIIRLANEQATRIFKYTRQELVGMSVERLVPERFRATHADKRATLGWGASNRMMGAGRELFALLSDGQEIPVEIGLGTVTAERGSFVLVSLVDIQERKRAEAVKDELIAALVSASHNLTSTASKIFRITTRQSAGVQEQAAAITQLTAAVSQLAQMSTHAAERANLVAESSQRTVTVSQEGRDAVENATTVIDAVKERVETLADAVLKLVDQAKQVDEIMVAVREVAEQTNLLALNASIEAARAGEHGRGFAVVASEVRDLATQSKRAAAQVRQILGDVQGAAESAIVAAQEGTRRTTEAIKVVRQAGETIRSLSETIAESAQSASQIAVAAGQYAVGMAQIREAASNIGHVTNENLATTREAEQEAKTLETLGATLNTLVATAESRES